MLNRLGLVCQALLLLFSSILHPIDPLSTLIIGVNLRLPRALQGASRWVEKGVGGVLMSGGTRRQIQNAVQHMRALREAPLLVCVDAEWGTAACCVDGASFERPWQMMHMSPAEVHNIYHRIGASVRDLGADLNCAPYCSWDSSGGQALRAWRCLGTSVSSVSRRLRAAVEGMQSAGCIACPKYLPGLRVTTQDPSEGLCAEHYSPPEWETHEYPLLRSLGAVQKIAFLVSHVLNPGFGLIHRPASMDPRCIARLRQRVCGPAALLCDWVNQPAARAFGSVPECIRFSLEAGCDYVLVGQEGLEEDLFEVTLPSIERYLQNTPWQRKTFESTWKMRAQRVEHFFQKLQELQKKP